MDSTLTKVLKRLHTATALNRSESELDCLIEDLIVEATEAASGALVNPGQFQNAVLAYCHWQLFTMRVSLSLEGGESITVQGMGSVSGGARADQVKALERLRDQWRVAWLGFGPVQATPSAKVEAFSEAVPNEVVF